MKHITRHMVIGLLAAAVLLAPFAGTPTYAQTGYTLTIAGGNNQSACLATAFADPLQVSVTDASLAPVAGVQVTFTAPASGASTDPATFTATTGADGVASYSATANLVWGSPVIVASIEGGASVTFNLRNLMCRPSFWMQDPLDPGQPAPDPATPPDTAVPGWWWRDTTNQNAIAQHSEDQFTGQVYQLYSSSKLKLLVYVSAIGSNSTAIVGTNSWYLVGPGGGRDEANYAKSAFSAFYPAWPLKTMKGLVLTGAGPEETWGGQIWRNAFRTVPPFPIYADAAYTAAKAERDVVSTEITAREDRVYGRVPAFNNANTPPAPEPKGMAWGPDGFLGAGSMRQYVPVVPFYAGPANLVSEDTTFSLDGSVPIQLLPTSDGSAGLMVWLPDQKILIAGDSGRYLPDAGSIRQAGASIPERIAVLDQMMGLAPTYFVPAHGLPITGAAAVSEALTAQRDALQSIYDQALARINAGDTIDEAAAAVALPADLAVSPYNRELVSTIPGIVRNIYTEKLGWFGGETHELASTLTPAAKAAALADALGGAENLLAAARTAELNARDLAGAEKALYLAEAAYEAAPENFTAKQVYAQALRKNAFLQKSAQVRNYYLVVARALGTDFTRSADEDNAIAFTADEFQRFSGLEYSLWTVTILTLPAAEHGVLALAGVPVTAGQVIPAAGLGGLVFTPAANWNGETGFTWKSVHDAYYESAVIPVTLTINPVNDAPAAAAPAADVAVDEDSPATTIDLSTIFADVDGDALTYAVASNSNPALVTTALNGATLTLSFAANGNGQASITVSATDPAGASVSDEFAMTVSPVNDPPTAADAQITVMAGQSQVITLNYGDLETAQGNLQVSFGTLKGTIDYSGLPSLKYTAPSTAGDDSFTYTVADRGDPDGCTTAPCAAPSSTTATVHVTVLAAPSGSISGQVYNDADGDGNLDAGETGLAGVTVQLKDASGSVIKTATTAADGAYTLTGLNAGTYQVYAEILDSSRVQTTPNPAAITLAEAEAKTGVNFGSVVSADLKVTMTASVSSKAIIYAITVVNDGPAAAADATLTDVLPGTVAYVSVVSTQGTCSGGKTVTCSFGSLAPGSSATVTLKVNRVGKLAVVNTATVTSSVFDIAPGNNSATATVQ